MTHTVLILGASYAGLTVAHKLLKHTAPSINDTKVVLVNPSSKFFWNLAAVRAIIPGQIKDEALFQDIDPGFKYAGNNFEFLVGSAKHVDDEKKLVSIATSSETQTQSYNELVLATGARSRDSTPWKASGTYEQILDELHKIQKKVDAAKSIVVAGAGPTGVETVAELGFEYGGKKNISIITTGPTIMNGATPAMTPAIIKGAEDELTKLQVKVIRNTRVTGQNITPNGQTELMLSTGKTLVTDLYLPTMGLIPNTEYLPKEMLNEKGEVMVDDTMAVKGRKDIYAVGDISDLQRSGWLIADAQAKHLAKSLDRVLRGRAPLPYKPSSDGTLIALGRNGGTGILLGWKVPSFMAYYAKVRTLGVDRMPTLISGKSL